MTDKTGGPAFPVNGYSPDFNGMTLRDYFAAKAMQGMMANSWNQNYDSWAHHAYQMADAMLRERDET